LLGRLITDWALRSTLEIADLCAARSTFLQRQNVRQPKLALTAS
jgi:hypothetical protein